jgi:O-antigen/teichoic acid export membrane protein
VPSRQASDNRWRTLAGRTPGAPTGTARRQNRAILDFGRGVVLTAACNGISTVAAGLAGITIARSLGPTVRGEYAAVHSWLQVVQLVGDFGLSAATTYFVAHDLNRSRDYLATARALMVAAGIAVMGVGLGVAPVLARGDHALLWGFRFAFVVSLMYFIGAPATSSLLATSLTRWNLAKMVQHLLYLAAIAGLYFSDLLDLMSSIAALAVAMLGQAAVSYHLCRQEGLTGGRFGRSLARPVSRYGFGQLTSAVPGLIANHLDQLALSLTVAPAVLGPYAVANSLVLLTSPLAVAIGNVAFPRLARQLGSASAARLCRWSLLLAAAVSTLVMLVLVLVAPWLIPLVFGPGFQDSIPLIHLLAPGAIFLACGQVCGDILRGLGRPFAVARAQWAAAIAMVALLAVLLPQLHTAGAAIAFTGARLLGLVVFALALRSALADHARSAVVPITIGNQSIE